MFSLDFARMNLIDKVIVMKRAEWLSMTPDLYEKSLL